MSTESTSKEIFRLPQTGPDIIAKFGEGLRLPELITDELRTQISVGRITEPIPDMEQYGKRRGASRLTVRAAYLALQEEGIIKVRQGRDNQLGRVPTLEEVIEIARRRYSWIEQSAIEPVLLAKIAYETLVQPLDSYFFTNELVKHHNFLESRTPESNEVLFKAKQDYALFMDLTRSIRSYAIRNGSQSGNFAGREDLSVPIIVQAFRPEIAIFERGSITGKSLMQSITEAVAVDSVA